MMKLKDVQELRTLIKSANTIYKKLEEEDVIALNKYSEVPGSGMGFTINLAMLAYRGKDGRNLFKDSTVPHFAKYFIKAIHAMGPELLEKTAEIMKEEAKEQLSEARQELVHALLEIESEDKETLKD